MRWKVPRQLVTCEAGECWYGVEVNIPGASRDSECRHKALVGVQCNGRFQGQVVTCEAKVCAGRGNLKGYGANWGSGCGCDKMRCRFSGHWSLPLAAACAGRSHHMFGR